MHWLKRFLCQHPPSQVAWLYTYHTDSGPVYTYGCKCCQKRWSVIP